MVSNIKQAVGERLMARCESCNGKVSKGLKSKNCGHWICGACLSRRSQRVSHMLGKDTLACVACGRDTGLLYDKVLDRFERGV